MTNLKSKVLERLELHERCFEGLDYPLLMISTAYPGLWLEHVYDSVIYAQMDKSKLYLAENAIRLFMENQKPNGQLPFMVRQEKVGIYFGYTQIQECVSFGSLALSVYELNRDKEFLKNCFESVKKWVNWLEQNRMTRKTGLIEMFCGYDTGHDNSSRVLDLGFHENVLIDGKKVGAEVLPPDDDITPVIAVDMNCNYFGNLTALAKMAKVLGEDGAEFVEKTKFVKSKIFEICFDKEDCFFYDVDKHGKKRKILSSQIFHLFIEGVLDKDEDAELIKELCDRYVFNEKHFYTPFPFPAVSVSDKTWKKHTPFNCWGYFTQGLIILRSILWMEKYGFEKQFEEIFRRWNLAWENCYDVVKFGQELDPITGEPSESSEWYSSCMLTYLYYKNRWEDK